MIDDPFEPEPDDGGPLVKQLRKARLRRNVARAGAWFATADEFDRDALALDNPRAYALRFVTSSAPSRLEGPPLARELCARMIALAEAAGRTDAFDFFPLGELDPLAKTANVVQAGAAKTPLQWRRAFDPEPLDGRRNFCAQARMAYGGEGE